ncbi:MAG: GNAT family N-acetyltransferase [Clostridia bacterium]|nr:GNAT family N-acetyltransferase [Clostridia bacterium]
MDVKIDISNVTLETPRVYLRSFKEGDINDLFEYCSVPGVGEAAGWKHHENLDRTRIILDMFIKEKNVFAIVLKENNKVIGSVGFHNSWAVEDKNFEFLNTTEIGYALSKEYWGRGLMTEVVKRVIDYSFEYIDIDVLVVGHIWNNDRSRRVIEKCGFKMYKVGIFYSKELDQEFDDINYYLTKKFYQLEIMKKR